MNNQDSSYTWKLHLSSEKAKHRRDHNKGVTKITIDNSVPPEKLPVDDINVIKIIFSSETSNDLFCEILSDLVTDLENYPIKMIVNWNIAEINVSPDI